MPPRQPHGQYPPYRQPQYNQPQYGQPQYGQSPYGQQPYGYPQGQYGQPGGPPPPPKKSRTGLWIGLSTGAVLVVAFLITGLVTPGFLLGDEGADTAAPGGTGSTAPFPGGEFGGGPGQGRGGFPGAPSSGPQDPPSRVLVQEFISTVNAGAGAAALRMVCARYRSDFEPFAETASAGRVRLTLLRMSENDSGRPTASIEGRYESQAITGSILLYEVSPGPYCIAGLELEYRN